MKVEGDLLEEGGVGREASKRKQEDGGGHGVTKNQVG